MHLAVPYTPLHDFSEINSREPDVLVGGKARESEANSLRKQTHSTFRQNAADTVLSVDRECHRRGRAWFWGDLLELICGPT